MGKPTETKVLTIKATVKDQWLNDGAGLYLRIHKGGSKVWIIRRKRFGKTQIITLDPYPTMKLKQARLKAAEYQLKKDVSNTSVEMLTNKYLNEIVRKDFKCPHFAEGYFNQTMIPSLGHRKVRDVIRTIGCSPSIWRNYSLLFSATNTPRIHCFWGVFLCAQKKGAPKAADLYG